VNEFKVVPVITKPPVTQADYYPATKQKMHCGTRYIHRFPKCGNITSYFIDNVTGQIKDKKEEQLKIAAAGLWARLILYREGLDKSSNTV
jgi:hypothetical protein